MAITNTWSVSNMVHQDSDGGVITVYWSMVAQNDSGPESATEGGKLRLTPDPSSSDYIPYADLTEADVLGWVYNSLIEGDETADEAKARVKQTVMPRCKVRLTVPPASQKECLGLHKF